MKRKIVFIIISLFSFHFLPKAQIITTVGEIHDGTAQDIAAGTGKIYMAQGRNLVIIDPVTGKKLRNLNTTPYPSSLNAVEYCYNEKFLFVATTKAIYIYQDEELVKTWINDLSYSISDMKVITKDNKICITQTNKFRVIDYSPTEPQVAFELSVPDGISFFTRIHLTETRNGVMAYLVGGMSNATVRGMNGLVIIHLDSNNDYVSPSVFSNYWDPVSHYSNLNATVRYVQVVENYNSLYTYAFVACGNGGQLTILDVTDPLNIQHIGKVDIAPLFSVENILLESNGKRLFVASTNLLHVIDLENIELKGSVNAGFFDAGNRDMTLYTDNENNKHIWTATNFSVDYVINSVDVTLDIPQRGVSKWWISSSDGAVAVPEWNSVYLPTFGGIIRYDISDETTPVAVDESYQPAGGTIEHIDIIFPYQGDTDRALLLTAPGNGGIQYWPISRTNPNPGTPLKVVHKLPEWGNDPVYQNDVGYYQKNGINYFLSDIANRKTHEVALQVYNTSTGEWLHAIEQSNDLKSNSKTIAVSGDYAFVSCVGGFFVVDLSGLPASVSISDVKVNDWNNDGKPDVTSGLIVSPDGGYIFTAADPGVVQSFSFNMLTGKVSGPLCILTGDGISGCTNRGRYHGPSDKLYIAGRGGNIMEIDAKDPYNLKLLSVWNNGGYNGEMQDCRLYNFGNGMRILAVKNNEGFAILDPGLSTERDMGQQLTEHKKIFSTNYPNPFNNSTIFVWNTFLEGHTRLFIYDFLGRQVAMLTNEYKAAGTHEVIFNPGKLDAGIYFYLIQIRNISTTGKILYIK